MDTAIIFPFPTIKGKAGELEVSWVVMHEEDFERVKQLELQYEAASEVLKLLLRNAYTLEGLNSAELEQAKKLIQTLPENFSTCNLCKDSNQNSKSIADTKYCRLHNMQNLITRN